MGFRMFAFALVVATATTLPVSPVVAGDFDGQGRFIWDDDAVAHVGFGADFDAATDRLVPPDAEAVCVPHGFEVVQEPSALTDGSYVHVNTDILLGCAERFRVQVPNTRASYRATVWMRHGSVDAQMTVRYPDGVRPTDSAKLFPTGQVTSDGWVELASNAFPVDGDLEPTVYLRIYDFDGRGSDIDALEVFADGAYVEANACSGVNDPVCGDTGVCVFQRCVFPDRGFPPLPHPSIRQKIIDSMQWQLQTFFGGRKSRITDLPEALEQLQLMRSAQTSFAYWTAWGIAARKLQDWHTRASVDLARLSRPFQLRACFIEGEADASLGGWPPHPQYHDILVSHTAGDVGAVPFSTGDRLVAVDGQHPIAWARELIRHDWGFWQANDDGVFAEFVERMPNLITAFGSSFSVIHCSPAPPAGTGLCDMTPTVYPVSALPPPSADSVRCDNRPFYHLTQNPGPSHSVGFDFFWGEVNESNPGEKIYSLVWDTLFGGGDPNGHVNGSLKNAFNDFRANARGVILDHRAGNGGTIDGAETATQLIRPPETVLVLQSPMEFAADDGPATAAEGIVRFNELRNTNGMRAGSANYDPAMPVALLLHRDGSASDFMPEAFKGASPKVRIFAPHATAGAFSTFYTLEYWGGLGIQMASGDSIASDGRTLIGAGVQPDVVVLPKQSDLLAGKDTIFEVAIAWVRQELKP